jgi:hypothetical protein
LRATCPPDAGYERTARSALVHGEQLCQQPLVFGVEFGQQHHLVIQATRERIVLVEVIGQAGGTQQAVGGPVQHGVAQDHVEVTRAPIARVAERAHGDLGAVEPLAHVIVGLALEIEAHAAQREGPEALSGAPVQREVQGAYRKTGIAESLGEGAGHARSHGEVVIAHLVRAAERGAGLDRDGGIGEDLVVEHLQPGAHVAIGGAHAGLVEPARHPEHQRQVQHRRARQLRTLGPLQPRHLADDLGQ